jgi:hypothetical protein
MVIPLKKGEVGKLKQEKLPMWKLREERYTG